MKKILLFLSLVICLSCNSEKNYQFSYEIEFTYNNGKVETIENQVFYTCLPGENCKNPFLYENMKDECWYLKYHSQVLRLACNVNHLVVKSAILYEL